MAGRYLTGLETWDRTLVPAADFSLLKVLNDGHWSKAVPLVYLLTKMSINKLMQLNVPLWQIHAILLVIIKCWGRNLHLVLRKLLHLQEILIRS